VNLSVYDITGREVVNLINEFRAAGINKIQFTSENVSSAAYFIRITTEDHTATRKMMLLK